METTFLAVEIALDRDGELGEVSVVAATAPDPMADIRTAFGGEARDAGGGKGWCAWEQREHAVQRAADRLRRPSSPE